MFLSNKIWLEKQFNDFMPLKVSKIFSFWKCSDFVWGSLYIETAAGSKTA